MNTNRRTILWPAVDTVEGARSALLRGTAAALFTASVTALAASWSLGSGQAAYGIVDPSAFVDVLIFAVLAFGIYKGSRIAAVAGLVIFSLEKISQFVLTGPTGGLPGVIMALFLVTCYLSAVRGAWALQRLRG